MRILSFLKVEKGGVTINPPRIREEGTCNKLVDSSNEDLHIFFKRGVTHYSLTQSLSFWKRGYRRFVEKREDRRDEK